MRCGLRGIIVLILLHFCESDINARNEECLGARYRKGSFFEDVVTEKHCRVLFRKGDEVEVKAEGFAEYYKATIIKVRRPLIKMC